MHQVCFDLDSFLIGIDSLSSVAIFVNKNHFQDLKLKQIRKITGIGVGLNVAGEGIFIMNIEDGDDRFHKIEIAYSLYVTGLWMVLLNS